MSFSISANAKSALFFFDTVVDINTLNESDRNALLKEVVVSAKEEAENNSIIFYSYSQEEAVNSVKIYTTLKDILRESN